MRAGAPSIPTLRECKIRASLLLKALRSDDPSRAGIAAERFRQLPRFAPLATDRLIAWRDEIQRKHALAVIAAELGFDSWNALRDASDDDRPSTTVDIERLFTDAAVYLNHWCRSYEDARAIHEEVGGFLFPYRAQFAVCPSGFLEAHGLDPLDPDWERIGRDWARPRDTAAFARLSRRLSDAGY
jgi:hypothetical protein